MIMQTWSLWVCWISFQSTVFLILKRRIRVNWMRLPRFLMLVQLDRNMAQSGHQIPETHDKLSLLGLIMEIDCVINGWMGLKSLEDVAPKQEPAENGRHCRIKIVEVPFGFCFWEFLSLRHLPTCWPTLQLSPYFISSPHLSLSA